MTQQDSARIAEDLWSALGIGDFDVARRYMHDDYVQEWPQSRERIVGAEDAMAVNRNFPGGLPELSVRRVIGDGDLAVLETQLRYADGSEYLGVSIIEVRDGKVVKETDYFAQPFDAPQWRAQWVHHM